MNLTGFEKFCDGPLWNSSLLLGNWWPEFTPCFISTVLVWLPCGYVWMLLPYFLYDVNNELITNNLQATKLDGRRRSDTVHQNKPGKQFLDDWPLPVVGAQTTRGAITRVCLLKIIMTCLLAALSLIHLMLALQDIRPTSEVVASALYLATYILVVFQLWYERRKCRSPTFVAFYFYALNILLGIVPFYTFIITENYRLFPGKFIMVTLALVVNFMNFVLTFVPHRELGDRKGYTQIGLNPCPETTAAYPSQVFFLWMLKLMATGFKREITADDVWDLNPRDQGRYLNARFNGIWKGEVERVDGINRRTRHRHGMSSLGALQNGKQQPETHSPNLTTTVLYGAASETTSLLLAEEYHTLDSQVLGAETGTKRPSLFRALARMFWVDTLIIIVQKVIADVALFMGPLMLGVLIERLQFPEEEKVWHAYTLSLGLLVTGMIKSVLFAHAMYRSALLGLQVKTTLVSAIYKKSLTISNSAKMTSTVGEIVNLMSVDCQRLEDVISMLFFIYTAVIQIVIAVLLLYMVIGPAVVTGVVLLVLTVPLNVLVGRQQRIIQDSVLTKKDERIKIVNQILNGMKVLKLYAWEDEFKKKVEAIRSVEIKHLYKIAFLNFFTGLCWGLAPFLVGFVTFATYVLIDRNNVLDPQKAFVCLALFNILKVPLNYFSTVITYTVQVLVSVKRVNTFLVNEDLNPSNTTVDPDSEHAISIRQATFTWDLTQASILHNINEDIQVGKLTAIVGPVGSGKTSLISAILGEMEKLQGQVTIKGSLAYVSQQAWIQNATVKDNILFGKKFKQHQYKEVIKVCELERDLTILEAGDDTEIGEKGINLSGGQKQRINLARAVYSNSDIYLFDDPLSAVDAHVGKSIFKNVVGNQGVLAKKTRVLVTHGIHWLPQVDHILVLSNGVISERGSYEQLISHNGPFAKLLQMHLVEDGNTMEEDTMEQEGDEYVRRTKVTQVASETRNMSVEEVYNLARSEMSRRRSSNRYLERSLSQPFLIHESLDLSLTLTSSVKPIHPVGGKLIIEEKLETGKVKMDVFVTYCRACGLFAMSVAVLCFVVNQGFLTWSSFFLMKWTEDQLLLNVTTSTSPEGTVRLDYYLAMYGGFFGIAQLLSFVVFNFLFWYRMVRAADRLHHMLLDRLFHAPMSFFDQTPIGRILNRFSKDIDTVDNAIPLILRDWLMTASTFVVTLCVVVIQTPIFAAVLIPLLVFFYIIQKYYVRTSRQLKRIESITRSPVYVHFSESITGAAVIRAYRATERFIEESVQKVDKNQLYFFASQAAIRWLQLNMDILANLVVLFAAIFQITSGGGGSNAGLSVSYALQISGVLTYMVRQICEFESNIVSVERLKEYSQVEQEAAAEIPETRPSPSWPRNGEVTFKQYQTRYRKGLDLVLKGVNCHINRGEKIGIVGRTGAGKSSLTLCLFRIIEAASGSITIDGVNIADIGLHNLRSKLTILPQDPVLFSGSLRKNIDPFGQYTDEQLWTALDRSHLKNFVTSQPSGLMYECGEEGSNLSIGQRQLVCLARSLLRHTKILVLDEATAAIDIETDRLIQNTIREAFKDCTIIAIAHRLNTIMDYDRIMVMDAGVIAEFDTPQNLINSRGIFYSMCKDSGLV